MYKVSKMPDEKKEIGFKGFSEAFKFHEAMNVKDKTTQTKKQIKIKAKFIPIILMGIIVLWGLALGYLQDINNEITYTPEIYNAITLLLMIFLVMSAVVILACVIRIVSE